MHVRHELDIHQSPHCLLQQQVLPSLFSTIWIQILCIKQNENNV